MNSIMVVGTTSHAGKSLITAAICRLLVRRGYTVTPFKGQNMALNAYVTSDGLEIGHAQAVQAIAAKIVPTVDMNPILLKPQGDMTSQVILMGKPVGKVQAADYYRDYFDRGWEAITSCLDRLKTEFDFIVCEGAGSPAEINLKHRDLTNMRVAKYLGAKTILVADIDRGGVFAHIVGTLELLDPEERALIKGIVINKFRGMRSLLESGITWLEERTKIPVIGVIPWITEAFPSEDSLSLVDRRSRKHSVDLEIGVIKLPRIANFTDFDPLDAEPTVSLKYITQPEQIGSLDALIIPGSKTSIADLLWLKSHGFEPVIRDFVNQGKIVMGICGGWQIMGEKIIDPQGLEGESGEYLGLGLMSISTTINDQKVTQQRSVISQLLEENSKDSLTDNLNINGYEIHQGITEITGSYQFLFSDDQLGIVDDQKVLWGTYLHGIFDNGSWRRMWLNYIRQQKKLPPLDRQIEDFSVQREGLIDRLTDIIGEYLDLDAII